MNHDMGQKNILDISRRTGGLRQLWINMRSYKKSKNGLIINSTKNGII